MYFRNTIETAMGEMQVGQKQGKGVNEGIKELDKVLKKRNGQALIFQIDLEAAFDSCLRIKM